MRQYTILGGGIAGLTTAIALQRIGIRAEVFEAAAEMKPVGAGLVLAANAIKGYAKLGIAEKVIARGRLLPMLRILDRSGRLITAADAEVIGRKYGIHNFAIHRPELHEALLDEIDPAQLHTGKYATHFDRANGKTTLYFQDGTSHQTDCLIVADGIHSPIRRQLLPASAPRYAGYTCWRAVIDNPGLPLAGATETWGSGGRFGVVPLANDRIYWFACVNAPQNDPAMRSLKITGLQAIFRRFHDPIPAILQHTPGEHLLWNDIIDLQPVRQFAFGNVVLIGDAAHATTPNMGQGACQAIEDAVILADEIARHQTPETAFAAFERRRLRRTHFIVNNSWNLGRIAQWNQPWLTALRNALFRMIPESVNERQLKKVLEVDFE